MNRTTLTLIPFLLLSLTPAWSAPAVAAEAGDVLIADFEGKTYPEGWKAEGEAFGKAPARGTLGSQQHVSGFEGKGLVNTFLGGDPPKGKLTSPEFTIERDYIKFLIGGGGHKGKTCMNLLIDGKAVLTATGPNIQAGGHEFLNWENWDVKKYKGKKATLQIVDDHSGGWGHINVDQISQSNKQAKKKKAPAPRGRGAPPLPSQTREIKITGKYIIFPVANSDQRRGRMKIMVGEQLVHHLNCDFPTSKEGIHWWTYLDMGEYKGKTATVSAQADPEICKLFESSDKIRNLQPLYDEALRPQFHISQKRGWNNDPNGMFYHDGTYHFFWQCNPAGRGWANMYWGHATSPDMVHWTEHDRALRSYGGKVKNRHPKMADGRCFSGSGNVDSGNTGGWQKGDEKTLVLAFTDNIGRGESLAYSTDRGKTWKYYEGNPIIKHNGRDPKLMWYAPGKHWVIAVYDTRRPHGNGIAIYTSKDLKKWEYASCIPGYFECAEIFQLPVDGNKNKTKWVIYAADARYAFGHFDGKKFTPEHKGKHRVHYGAYYASQCFSNSPDGRMVQIGWARINIPNMPFNQTFTVPTNLTLHTTKDGVRMFATPIKELDKLRKPNPKSAENTELADKANITFAVKGQLFDIVVTVKKGTAKKAVLKYGACTTTYDFEAQKVDEMPVAMKDGKVTFRVLVDRPIVEVIGGGGAGFKTTGRRDPGKDLGEISLTAEGGAMSVESFKAYEMKSAWKKK